jgi:arsenite methyltransferase
MAVQGEIDVAYLKSEIKRTYAEVSEQPQKDFIFPTGRTWAEDLDYSSTLLDRVPDRAVESFAGVANPFALGALEPGEHVLDLGCGAGTDTLVAAQMVAPDGEVTGIDMTPEMLEKARAAAGELGATNVDFVEGEVERLPFGDGAFDVVISNGVIDLVPDKDAVFTEIYRVLKPGGTHSDRRRFHSETGERGGAAQHRSLDRLNCRCSAGGRVRGGSEAARVRADRVRKPRRHLHALEVRRHAAEGAQVRSQRIDPQGVQGGKDLKWRTNPRLSSTSPPGWRTESG